MTRNKIWNTSQHGNNINAVKWRSSTPVWQCMWDKSVCHTVAFVDEPFPIELLYESPISLSKRNERFSSTNQLRNACYVG